MPLDNRITRQRVYEIAETLKAENKPITIDAIQAVHGGGSAPTVCKYLRAWREETGANKIHSPAIAKEPMSEATQAAWLADLAGREAKVKAEYAQVIEAGEKMIESLLKDAEITAAHAADQAQEIDRLNSELAARTAETQTAEKAAEAAEAGRLEAQAQSNHQSGVIEELRHQIAILTADKDKAQALAESTLAAMAAMKAIQAPATDQEAKTRSKKSKKSGDDGNSTPEATPESALDPDKSEGNGKTFAMNIEEPTLPFLDDPETAH